MEPLDLPRREVFLAMRLSEMIIVPKTAVNSIVTIKARKYGVLLGSLVLK
jgi:hypothetical protein